MNQMHSRGFAIAIAIIFVAIVGVTIALLSVGLANDAKQTHVDRNQAQIEQLLLAGAVSAKEHLENNESLPAPWSIKLPVQLSEAAVKVKLSKSGESICSADVEVTTVEAKSHEAIAFERKADRWIVVGVK